MSEFGYLFRLLYCKRTNFHGALLFTVFYSDYCKYSDYCIIVVTLLTSIPSLKISISSATNRKGLCQCFRDADKKTFNAKLNIFKNRKILTGRGLAGKPAFFILIYR